MIIRNAHRAIKRNPDGVKYAVTVNQSFGAEDGSLLLTATAMWPKCGHRNS